MVYCTKCGAENEDDAKTCVSCGEPLQISRVRSRSWDEELDVRAEEFGMRAEEFGKRMERGIADGLAWLNLNFSVRNNPGPRGGRWHYYYLYGLERTGVLTDKRTGVLTDKRFMGDHDWYREGAEYLVRRQRADGSWPGGLMDSCFALLFLRRATVPVRVPKETTPEPVEGEVR